MANTLTISSFAENLFAAKDIIANEPCAFLNNVLINSSETGISINGTVTSLVTAQPTLNTSATPAMTIPDGDDQTITTDTMTITKTANVKIPMVGEVWKKLENTAGGQGTLTQMLAQALRKIRNAIEAHIGLELKNNSSRAVGTAGTTPFASSHALIPQANQILTDNGAPEDGLRSLVVSTGAATNLKLLSNLYKVNEGGSDATLRRGILLDIDGVAISSSAGVASHTKGAATGTLINIASGEAIGETTLTLDTITVNTTGILAGDVITHASDSTNKYVVKTGLVATSGDIVIHNPGLKIAAANNDAVTIGNSYTANMLFHRDAVELVVRPMALPPGGDAAIDHMVLSDTKTGLVFDIAIYGGYKMQMLDITTYYQAKVWKPEFVATLMG